jgi:hypothetical protein
VVTVVKDRYSELRLELKVGPTVCTQAQPLEWLGIQFHRDHLDVSLETIQSKIFSWTQKASLGLLTSHGVEDAMEGLIAHYRDLIPNKRLEFITTQMRKGVSEIHFLSQTGREDRLLQSLLTA